MRYDINGLPSNWTWLLSKYCERAPLLIAPEQIAFITCLWRPCLYLISHQLFIKYIKSDEDEYAMKTSIMLIPICIIFWYRSFAKPINYLWLENTSTLMKSFNIWRFFFYLISVCRFYVSVDRHWYEEKKGHFDRCTFANTSWNTKPNYCSRKY